MSWRRTVNNFCWFLAAFTATLCLGIACAYASTATWDGTAFTFEGRTCKSLLETVTRVRMNKYGQNITSGKLDFYACSIDPLTVSTVKLYLYNNPNGAAGVDSAVISSLDDVANPDAPDTNEKGYLAWVGIACCWGLGILAGLQR